MSYDLFDGGSREAKLKQAKIELEMAETELQQTEADVAIQISAAYDKTEQLQQLISVVDEALRARLEAARVSAQRVTQNADLPSSTAKDDAAVYDTRASLLEAKLGLFLAQNSIQQLLGSTSLIKSLFLNRLYALPEVENDLPGAEPARR